MSRNTIGFGVNSVKFQPLIFGEKIEKRRLSKKDRDHLYYHIGKKKCQSCGKRIEERDMQEGHKKAYSKGGKTKLENAVCLCYTCNKAQGTDSWKTYNKKKGTPIVSLKLESKKKSSKRKSKKLGESNWVNPVTSRRVRIEPIIKW